LAFLSDLDVDTGDDTSPSSLSDDESKRKVEDKLNGLCFLTKSVKEGYCGMAVEHNRSGDGGTTGNNSDSEVPPSADELATELETMNDALLSQDKVLRHVVKERNELKVKLEHALKDLKFASAAIVVF